MIFIWISYEFQLISNEFQKIKNLFQIWNSFEIIKIKSISMNIKFEIHLFQWISKIISTNFKFEILWNTSISNLKFVEIQEIGSIYFRIILDL